MMTSLRSSALLLLAALGLATIGCAGGPGASLDDSAPLEALDENDIESPVPLQTPPVKIMISGLEERHVAIVATKTGIGRFLPQTEYWAAQPALRLESELILDASPIESSTERDLDEWLSPFADAFNTPRLVHQEDWKPGIAELPAGLNQYLYWTQNPDDERDTLGVLLVTENRSGFVQGETFEYLVAAAWYRPSAPTTDGMAFRSSLFTQRMSLVVDRDGVPSRNPNDLFEADWHNVVMPIPTSAP